MGVWTELNDLSMIEVTRTSSPTTSLSSNSLLLSVHNFEEYSQFLFLEMWLLSSMSSL
jgi:hypothetical protein